MAETTAQVWRAAHLPEQPAQGLGTCRAAGQKHTELFSQMQQDCAALEHAHRLRAAAVHQRGDLRVGIGGHKTTAELLAFTDADQPGVVLGAAVAQRQQFFQHDRHFHTIGRGQRVQLHGVAAHRQVLVKCGARHRAVDVGKLATIGFVPGPDFGGCVGV